MPISEVYLTDCLSFMRGCKDKEFDICIADPPYGVSYARGKNGYGVKVDNLPTHKDVDWDAKIPEKEFFDELLRVSDKVIIWGGNYFTHLLPVSKCWIVWDKCDGMENKSPFADAELAWTNMTKVVSLFRMRQLGFISDTQDTERIHPTQKPTELYAWLLRKYANKGDKVFDPFLGSGSSRIAAYKMGFDFIGCEISDEYFHRSNERFLKECKGISKTRNGKTITELNIF